MKRITLFVIFTAATAGLFSLPWPWCWSSIFTFGAALAVVLSKFTAAAYEANAERIKSARGYNPQSFIAQCAWCKRIRTVEGTYVEPVINPDPHRVTHTICDDCAAKEHEHWQEALKSQQAK